MQVKYPAKAAKWQPQYIGFDTKKIKIDVDTRIFPPPIIERTLSMLSDQVEEAEFEEHDSPRLTIHLSFFSDMGEGEIEDLFYAKLICASVMLLTFEKTTNIRELFYQTAQFATTDFQNQLNDYRRMETDQENISEHSS